MIMESNSRNDLVRRCNELERRFIAIQRTTKSDCSIAIWWARQWASTMLDTKEPTAIYANWIEQQEQRADRMEARIPCKHNYAYTSGIGMGQVIYRCTLCGDEYEKDVS